VLAKSLLVSWRLVLLSTGIVLVRKALYYYLVFLIKLIRIVGF